jgi:hypothetical protein
MMGEIELDSLNKTITIHSHIITYGNAADAAITSSIREEIEMMWNEPAASIFLNKEIYSVIFQISSEWQPGITPIEIYEDTNPRNNFFRIEKFALGNISFVDGIGCNSGYFLLENLYKCSTTAAHEYGHTIGLHHPADLDYRGKGIPGIMYPRGTLVDPPFQYEPHIPPGQKGGTMHPMYRKVRETDIADLKLNRLTFNKGKAMLGDFTNIFHTDHSTINT